MKILYSYIKSAIYNIGHNKSFALFYIFGTAFTFIFVSIVLQLRSDIVSSKPPRINADRTVDIFLFKDDKGQSIEGLRYQDVPLLLTTIKGYKLCALMNCQYLNMLINDKVTNGMVTFVNGDYWKINEFNFIAGRSFTEEEVLSKKPVVVIRKSFAESNFKIDEILGQKVEFQNVYYTIIGIVDNYSYISGGFDQVWAPATLNKFTPSGYKFQNLHILPKEDVSLEKFKSEIVVALRLYYKNKSLNIDIDDVLTYKEALIGSYGGISLSYGVSIIILILLIIPSINIVVISIANIKNRAKEIAIKRSLGATILSSFIQIMVDYLLLVIVGTIIGVACATPIARLISIIFLSDGMSGYVSLINEIDVSIFIFRIIPLSILFTLLSGGIPSYLIIKDNIAETLKGGTKC